MSLLRAETTQSWLEGSFTVSASLMFAGPDNLEDLKRIAQQYQKSEGDSALRTGGGAAALEEDDEVPELVEGETFEATAAKAE